MSVKQNISRLKYVSLCLFLAGTIAIIGSLIFNNFIFNYSFQPGYPTLRLAPQQLKNKLSLLKEIPGDYVEVFCDESNNYCRGARFFETLTLKKNTLDTCFKYDTKNGYIIDGKKEYGFLHNNERWVIKKKPITLKNFKIFLEVSEEKNETTKNSLDECIKNSKHYLIYKIVPSFYEFIYKIKFTDGIILGSNATVNPFLYGETSISNLAKRFPIDYIFKSFLFLCSILMIFYWTYYNNFFNNMLNCKKNKFYIFGICSAIFLFFHVLFLGMEYDNKLFQTLRKLIIILFIFSELGAQLLLGIDLYKKKDALMKYCSSGIIHLKYYFILILSFMTSIFIFYMVIFKPGYVFNNVLEWNYFIILLLFYLLSFFLWKRKL